MRLHGLGLFGSGSSCADKIVEDRRTEMRQSTLMKSCSKLHTDLCCAVKAAGTLFPLCLTLGGFFIWAEMLCQKRGIDLSLSKLI